MKYILKFIYQAIPFKKSIFILIRSLVKLSENTYKHLHFKGDFTVHIDKTHRFLIHHYGYLVENEVFWGGLYGNAWESVSLKYWTELCRDADCIIDVGANTGIYSLVAKGVNADATVIAFEPVKRVYAMLEANKKLNDFDIQCVEKALSNYDGEAIIYDDKNSDHTYSVTVNKNLLSATTTIIESKIETITLKSFIEQHHVKKIDLIKIDVETHEPEVLEGFGKYLDMFQPTMLIEILNDEVAMKVQDRVKGIPYVFFNINEQTGPRKVNSLSKSDGYNFLLCKKEIAEQLGLAT